AAGSMEFLANGAWTKRLHPGWSAHAGLHAAALARAGFRAPTTILEGRSGFLRAYSDGADPAALRARSDYQLLRTSIKPHACCRYMQGPIDGTLALRTAHRIEPADVERVEVGMLAAGFAIVCEPLDAKLRPGSVVDAQFSLPYGIAVALACGSASPAEFAPARIADPTVIGLAARVRAVRDRRLDVAFPREWPSWVRITLRGGRVHEMAVSHPRGDPENFPAPAELDAKFRTLARRALPAAAVARVAAAVDVFATAPSVASLMAAAVPLVG
ncbi:MAG: MmgE/PrpD family protein, partial [Deltaproteobacteria bacterium]